MISVGKLQVFGEEREDRLVRNASARNCDEAHCCTMHMRIFSPQRGARERIRFCWRMDSVTLTRSGAFGRSGIKMKNKLFAAKQPQQTSSNFKASQMQTRSFSSRYHFIFQ